MIIREVVTPDRDLALKKIQKLRNQNGRTEAEKEAANAIISRLIQKFNFTERELNPIGKTKDDHMIDYHRAQKQMAAELTKAEWNRLVNSTKAFFKNIFKEDIITELNDNPLPYKAYEESFGMLYRFNVNGIPYDVEFEKQGDQYAMAFYMRDKNGKALTHKTNTGNSFKVFSTVISILNQFINKYQPSKVEFIADQDEPSRIRLYDTIIHRLRIPNYTATRGKIDKYGLVGYTIAKANADSHLNQKDKVVNEAPMQDFTLMGDGKKPFDNGTSFNSSPNHI